MDTNAGPSIASRKDLAVKKGIFNQQEFDKKMNQNTATVEAPKHVQQAQAAAKMNPVSGPIANVASLFKKKEAAKGMKVSTYANGGLYANINKRKKAGTSRSKSNSTISPENYASMKKGFPKGDKGMKINKNKKKKKGFDYKTSKLNKLISEGDIKLRNLLGKPSALQTGDAYVDDDGLFRFVSPGRNPLKGVASKATAKKFSKKKK